VGSIIKQLVKKIAGLYANNEPSFTKNNYLNNQGGLQRKRHW
jgi:hypothetical protein